MNTWIKSIDSKDALLEINWQTELPEEYQNQVNAIYSQSLSIVNTIMEKFLPEADIDSQEAYIDSQEADIESEEADIEDGGNE